jgi:serine/threonine-protein kinase
MGEVWRAFDTAKERRVALKRLPVHLGHDTEFQVRFRRESKLAAQLTEPHIIPIHDFGEIDGRLFLDMRLVHGKDLAQLILEQGPLAPSRAANIVTQIASALDAAHHAGLVHRDIKPSNTLITGPDREIDYVYLVDFGIARSAGGTSLTGTGATIGTLDYMAPERFLTGQGDHRVDIYSLTCLFYECLTGRRPFPGEGLPAQMYAHVHSAPPAPSHQDPQLSIDLDQIIATGMAKDPDHRYHSAGALAIAVRTTLNGSSPPATASAQTIIVDRASTGDHSAPSVEPPNSAPATSVAPTLIPRHVPYSPPQSTSKQHARMVTVGIGLVIVLAVTAGVLYAADRSRTVDAPNTVIATIPIPGAPESIAVAPDGSYLYVTASEGRSPGLVEVIDSASNKVAATIPVNGAPEGVAITPDGRWAYLAARSLSDTPGGTISVIDTASNTVSSTIPVGSNPQGLAISPDGRRVYVTNSGTYSWTGRGSYELQGSTVSVIDTSSNTVDATIPCGSNPKGVGITPNNRSAYIAESGPIDIPGGAVSEIDTATNTVTSRVMVGEYPQFLAITPDGRRAYVSNSGPYGAAGSTVSVINTDTNTVIETISVGSKPQGLAIAPDGLRAVVASRDTNSAQVIDTTYNTVVATIPVGGTPLDVAISADGREAFTTDVGSHTVSVIALK